MKQQIKNKKLALRRTFLIMLDILVINLTSFLTIIFRFDFSVNSVPQYYYEAILNYAPYHTIASLLIFCIFRLYHSLWRYASIEEVCNVLFACILSEGVQLASIHVLGINLPRSYVPLNLIFLITFMVGTRFFYRFLRMFNMKYRTVAKNNIMIVGAGEAANMIIKEIIMSSYLNSNVVCAIDDSPSKLNSYIQGVKVVGGRDKIIESVEKYQVTDIIIAMPSVDRKKVKSILDICKNTGCNLKILPGVYQLINDEVNVSRLRNVEIEDLLGRDPIELDTESIIKYVQDKVVLVTGGGGSIGSELCRQIVKFNPKQLIIFDVYENNAYDIQQELKTTYPNANVLVLIGSVRNTDRINWIFDKYRPNIVYHAAAHKHVPLMEDSPNEAIKNNVFGTYKTAVAADRYGTEKFVLISTDKAVNPTNIMGASKRLCEMIIQGFHKKSATEFVAVRFGNVLGSNGSVIPLFRKQIEAGGPVTVTHPDIIRYFMTIPEAVSLVIEAGALGKGGEIFVLDMGEPMKIVDLAKNLIRLSGYRVGTDIQIKFTGLRPGEKLYEEMLMDEEGLKKTENKLIFIGKPIDFDESTFFEKLELLYESAYKETSQMKDLVKELVPTYQIREEDRRRDHEIVQGQFKQFDDIEMSPGELIG